MKNNRCFKLTALLLLAMIMVFSMFSALAEDGNDGAEAQIGPVGDLVIAARPLDSTFIKKADIMMDGKTKVTLDEKADPNHSYVLKLEVSEPVGAAGVDEMLPEDTNQVTMSYALPNVTIENGENGDVSWNYLNGAVIFKWVNGRKTSFSADIMLTPAYPAEKDLSGSYVLGTGRNSMLGTRAFKDNAKNRDKLYASEYIETAEGIYPGGDENPVWVLEHFTGNYYTLRAQNTDKYIYISPANKGSYLANSLYLVEGTRETAQKILVTDVGGGYYSFTYTHTDGKKYAINNSGNDKVENSAINGFGCWTYNGQLNEKFKLYSPSALINRAVVDLSGTWFISNTANKVTLTAETSQTNRLGGMKYSMDNNVIASEGDAVAFTFEHVIRDWYTVRTDAGYLNITKDGALISSNPQRLLVKTNNNYESIVLATGEYIGNVINVNVYPVYALSFAGNSPEEFGSVVSNYSNNTRMQLLSTADAYNKITTAFLFFDPNGGIVNDSPDRIIGKAGEEIILPELSGTKNGEGFIGWCELSNAFKRVKGNTGVDHTYHDVYVAGSTYKLKTGSTTLYAVYNTTNKDVRFGIRIDGVIQDEPNGFPTNNYTGHLWLYNDLKIGKWIVDINATKPIEGYTLQNNVTANLNNLPTADQINEALRKDPNKTTLTFDPETQYVHWYVFKYTAKNDVDGEWHVDGVIRNKGKVGVSYNSNVTSLEKASIKDMPGGEQVVVGSEILIGTNANSTEILRPIREGYVFNGWNTEPDGSGTSYSEGHYVKLTENLNLYAQWVKSDEGKLIIKINPSWPEGKPAYEGTEITLTAELTGFEGKEYTLQWQYSTDLENWIDEPGANGIDFTYTMNETTATYTWRVIAKDIH